MTKELSILEAMGMGLKYINAKLFNKRVPLAVSWALTYRCNHKCSYCGLWKKETQELTAGQIFAVIDELALAGTQYIGFTGGEPLIREDIGEIIKYALSKNIKVRVNSNGSLVREKIGSLKGIDTLNISLNGPEEVHDSVCGKGSYKEALEAVETAQKNGIKAAFITVLSKNNLDSLDFILLKAREYGVEVNFQPVTKNILGELEENNEIPAPRDYQKAIMKLKVLKRADSRLISNTLEGLDYLGLYPEGRSMKCASGWLTCRIEPDGAMVHCSRKPVNKMNCASESAGKAFLNLDARACGDCWCSARVELNMLWSLNLKCIYERLSGDAAGILKGKIKKLIMKPLLIFKEKKFQNRCSLIADAIKQDLNKNASPGSYKILDVGADDGSMLAYLANVIGSGNEYVGIEPGIDSDMKNNDSGVIVYRKRAEEMDFEDNYFDFIIASLSIEHMENPGVALPKIQKMLKPGGKFIVMTVFPFYHKLTVLSGYKKDSHYNNYSLDETAELVEKNYFKVIQKMKIPFPMSYQLVVTSKPADNGAAAVNPPGVPGRNFSAVLQCLFLAFLFVAAAGINCLSAEGKKRDISINEIKQMRSEIKENRENKSGLEDVADNINTEKDRLKKREMVYLLGETKDEQYKGKLQEVILSTSEPHFVRMPAIESLAQVSKSTTTLYFLEAVALNPEEKIGVRRMAVKTSARMPGSVDVLIGFLENNRLEETLRLEALNWLARKTDDEKVLIILKKYKTSGTKNIRERVTKELDGRGIK